MSRQILETRPSDPLILTRWIDVAYIALWMIYGCWGVTVFIAGLPTITQAAPDWYEAAWSGCVGVLSFTAAVCALLVFFHTPHIRQVTKKRIELDAVVCLTVLIALYPLLLIFAALNGDMGRAAIAVLSTSYLVFPVLRIYVLRLKIRGHATR